MCWSSNTTAVVTSGCVLHEKRTPIKLLWPFYIVLRLLKLSSIAFRTAEHKSSTKSFELYAIKQEDLSTSHWHIALGAMARSR